MHGQSRLAFALLIGANLHAQTPTDDEPLPPGARLTIAARATLS